MFFKSKPNLPVTEKAQTEFYFQQVSECVGSDRIRLPVLNRKKLHDQLGDQPTPEAVVSLAANHLHHDASGIRTRIEPKQGAACGGGG